LVTQRPPEVFKDRGLACSSPADEAVKLCVEFEIDRAKELAVGDLQVLDDKRREERRRLRDSCFLGEASLAQGFGGGRGPFDPSRVLAKIIKVGPTIVGGLKKAQALEPIILVTSFEN
jgi:hypothetical protein